MNEAFIISAVRTPIGIGKPNGGLHHYLPVDLAAAVLNEAIRRAEVAPERVQDVILGCVSPIGEQGGNLARLAVLRGGLPISVPGVTLNRMCGSGQQAIHFAAQAILAEDADIVLAGGVEMMSRVPLGSDWPPTWVQTPYELPHQGISAELLAKKYGLTRDQLDDYAYQSHLRAGNALQHGFFASQILSLPRSDGSLLTTDEGVRLPPNREKMAALKPVFDPDGVITAGNSSQISDGAAALLLASPQAVGRYNLNPLARIVTRVVVGSNPTLMLDGPIPATQLALKRAGLTLNEISVVELNEAFASVPLAWLRTFDYDPARLNPNGGAIAHGHPLGATGAILMTKLLAELQRTGGKYGLQTMCIGHGMATATVIERL